MLAAAYGDGAVGKLAASTQAATILIVDDELNNRKLLEVLLRPEGYRTRTAADGDEGLASVAQGKPDLILLDIMMPGIDGYQVAKILKSDPGTSNIPIIMVTAQTSREALLAGLNSGAEDLLTKPVDRAELSLRVRNLLRLKAMGDVERNDALLGRQMQTRAADLQRATQLKLDDAAQQMAVLNSLPARVALLNRDGCIISVNDEWQQFANANLVNGPEYRVGSNYLLVCGSATNEDGADTGTAAGGISSVLNGSTTTFALEYKCHSSGEENWFHMTVTPLIPDQLSGVIVMHTNITASKKAETEISRLNSELEERVRMRTSQLQLANKELEAFSYSASHDLRTPLSAINGYSTLLGKELGAGASERSQHYLSRIRVGVVQMGELIDALLSLAQISRKKLSADDVDLSTIAQSLVEEYRQRDPQRQVLVTIEPNLRATGDHRLLQEVLDNLLGNAWKYSSKTVQASIHFGASTGSAEGRVYTVQDNGAGFDMAYADKLFGAFQRLHTADEFAGSGIGLATVHRIVTRHGGRIWAESAPGLGASFHFTLGTPEDGELPARSRTPVAANGPGA